MTDDENRAARRVHAPADVAEVGVRDVLDFRQRRPVSRTNVRAGVGPR